MSDISKTPAKLSAIIVTKNEEKKIERCLESIRWVDEIVVIDQSSTDNTVSICKKYTDKVFVVSPKGFCEPDRPVAVSKATNDWLLYVDADEEISLELKSEIETILSEGPSLTSYYVPRKNIFLGKWIKGSGWYPGYVLRLFKKGHVKFSEKIHTDVIPLGSFSYLRKNIIHYTGEDIGEYIQKLNRYTEVLASERYVRGERIYALNFILKLFAIPSAYFFYKLIFKKGLRDGFHGVLIAFLGFLTVFIMYVKLWEMDKIKSKR